MKIKFIIIIIILILFVVPYSVKAAEAEDISAKTKIIANNQNTTKLSDNNTNTKITINEKSQIKIESEQNIGSIYIKYEGTSVQGVMECGSKQYKVGENGFLHEYIQIQEKDVTQIIIEYTSKVQISEIYCFTEGEVPSWVQNWKTQTGEVDLMLFSTHSDDEHLFFAGLLPNYVAKQMNVQVIYLTNHNDAPTRLHEQLDGLWNVGVTNYPIIGNFPDAYATTTKQAIQNLEKAGYTEQDVIKFQVEQIRKYKPLVIVGHDENGEYNHGQHMLNTYALKQAIEKSNDETYNSESIEKYGIWQVPKLYLHLYQQNQIKMNYDVPLEYFNGKTAYEMSKIGYSFHKSQQYTWFTKWLKGENNSYTSATQIKTYSPTEFGLYYSNVGEDINKNDMFENIEKSNFRKTQTSQEEQQITQQKANNSNMVKISIAFAIIIIFIIGVIIYKFNSHKCL